MIIEEKKDFKKGEKLKKELEIKGKIISGMKALRKKHKGK